MFRKYEPADSGLWDDVSNECFRCKSTEDLEAIFVPGNEGENLPVRICPDCLKMYKILDPHLNSTERARDLLKCDPYLTISSLKEYLGTTRERASAILKKLKREKENEPTTK